MKFILQIEIDSPCLFKELTDNECHLLIIIIIDSQTSITH